MLKGPGVTNNESMLENMFWKNALKMYSMCCIHSMIFFGWCTSMIGAIAPVVVSLDWKNVMCCVSASLRAYESASRHTKYSPLACVKALLSAVAFP